MRHLAAMLLSALLLVGLVGCGSDHPFDNIKEPTHDMRGEGGGQM